MNSNLCTNIISFRDIDLLLGQQQIHVDFKIYNDVQMKEGNA